MKANEAPEKIYLQQYDEDTLICLNKYNIHEEWAEKPCNPKIATNIEYTRTDAFIEKACEWLKEQDEMVGVSFEEDFIERFKEYMKG